MEEIVGPINGFYVASYAGPSFAAQSYTGYAKICRDKPVSYWEAQCVLKLFAGEHHATAAQALAAAHHAARDQIADLPSLECSTFGLDIDGQGAPPGQST